MFLRPAGIGGRILGRGTGVAFGLLRRVTGVDLLEDLSVFFRALGGMIDGFAARADRVSALLADPGTTFLIVTSPQHDPIEEAIFFHRKLREAGMPFGGIVVNRLHTAPGAQRRAARRAGEELGERLAGRVATSARELAALAERDAANVAHLRERLGDPPLLSCPSARTTSTTSRASPTCARTCGGRGQRRAFALRNATSGRGPPARSARA